MEDFLNIKTASDSLLPRMMMHIVSSGWRLPVLWHEIPTWGGGALWRMPRYQGGLQISNIKLFLLSQSNSKNTGSSGIDIVLQNLKNTFYMKIIRLYNVTPFKFKVTTKLDSKWNLAAHHPTIFLYFLKLSREMLKMLVFIQNVKAFGCWK